MKNDPSLKRRIETKLGSKVGLDDGEPKTRRRPRTQARGKPATNATMEESQDQDPDTSSASDVSSDSDIEIANATQYMTAANSKDCALGNSWVYDIASNCHVSNGRTSFQSFREYKASVLLGDTVSAIQGIGRVDVLVQKPNGSVKNWYRNDVLFVTGMHMNIVFASRCRMDGIFLNESKNALNNSSGKAVGKLEEVSGMWVLEHHALIVYAVRSSKSEPVSKGSVNLWRTRMAHLSKSNIAKNLYSIARDISITDLKDYDTHDTPPLRGLRAV